MLKGLFDKIGVSVETLGSAQDAGMWSATQPFNDSQKEKFDAQLGDIYDAFIDRVMEGRKMTRAEAESVAQGRVFTGQQAKANHLVDELGGLDRAINEAKKLAKLEGDIPVQRFPAKKSTIEMFLSIATQGVSWTPEFKIDMEDVLTALQARAVSQKSLKMDVPAIR